VRGLALCAVLLACACSDGGGGPQALFELSVLSAAGDPALDFFALPYPNDLRLDADGTPALARFPRPDAILSNYVDVVDATGHGFGLSGAVYLRFAATRDPARLPDPAGTLAEDAAVFLLDVTPRSAHRGERIPLRISYTARPPSRLRRLRPPAPAPRLGTPWRSPAVRGERKARHVDLASIRNDRSRSWFDSSSAHALSAHRFSIGHRAQTQGARLRCGRSESTPAFSSS
jgi:hypothetical protein